MKRLMAIILTAVLLMAVCTVGAHASVTNVNQLESYYDDNLGLWYYPVEEGTYQVDEGPVVLRFVPEVSGTYIYSSEGDRDSYGVISYASTGDTVSSDEDSGENYNFRMEAQLISGETYYLLLDWSDNVLTPTYVTIECESDHDAPAVVESVISANQWYDVDIVAYEQQYVFEFVPQSAGEYAFRSEGDYDTCGYILSADYGELSYNDDYDGLDFNVRHVLEAGETYYLVARMRGQSIGLFHVSVTLVGEELGDVPNDDPTPDDGPTIRDAVVGVGYPVSLPDDESERWFTFVPTVSGEYVFHSTGASDSYGWICDEDGNVIANNDDGGIELNFAVCCELTAGCTYTLVAKTLNGGGDSFFVAIQPSAEYVEGEFPEIETEGETETESETTPVVPSVPGQQGHVHTYDSPWIPITYPDCVNNGYSVCTCVTCGKMVTNTVPAKGHSFTENTQDNVITRTCTVCGAVETETIPEVTTAGSEPETETGKTSGGGAFGCRSALASAALLPVMALAGAVVMRKKKD